MATGECCFTAETQRTLRNGLLRERHFGKGGREQAHDGKIIRESIDCKCKCIVTTNISYSYLGFDVGEGGRRVFVKVNVKLNKERNIAV